jgi:hypothetical protein
MNENQDFRLDEIFGDDEISHISENGINCEKWPDESIELIFVLFSILFSGKLTKESQEHHARREKRLGKFRKSFRCEFPNFPFVSPTKYFI